MTEKGAIEEAGFTPEGFETAIQPVLDQVTEDVLRPALLAAGLDPDRYRLAWAPGEPEDTWQILGTDR